ncbi:alpha/beta fold hydrolase [soil metagenome]
MNARLVVVVALALVLCPLAVSGQASAAHPSGSELGPLDFAMVDDSLDVGERRLAVRRGIMSVPADRSVAHGPRITLRFVIFPSTMEVPAPPIVFLAGGPGDAATRALAGMPAELLDRLRAIGDVVAFDQRGTGTSEPLQPLCPPGEFLPRDRPGDPDAMIMALTDRVKTCLADRGDDLVVSGLTTAESADDLEALRLALGAPALSLLAGSYGTHLAMTTARRHPGAVHRMALLGVEGPDHTFKLPSAIDEVVATIAAERRLTLVDEIRTLRTRLANAPALFTFPTGESIVLGEWDLQRWVAESLDTRREIDALVAAVPAMIDGEYTPLAQSALQQRLPRPLNLMNLAMDCASFASAGRLDRIHGEVPNSLLGMAMDYPLPGLCEVEGLPRLPETFREPLESDVPTLLIAGTFDGRTPVRNAREVAEGLSDAAVFVIEGASHDLFRYSEAMDEVIAFLGADLPIELP